MIAKLLRRLADRIDSYRWTEALEARSPIESSEKLRNERSEVALRMLDPEVHGYLVLMLRATPGKSAGIEIKGHVNEAHWPAFRETLSRTETMVAEHVVHR